jgi:hypothetical protein
MGTSALGAFEDVFAAHVGNAKHGQHAGAGGHAAKIGGLGEGDVAVLHLDPNSFVAEVGADF